MRRKPFLLNVRVGQRRALVRLHEADPEVLRMSDERNETTLWCPS
jgi:hypothetical protein